jgi:hypothetical protein
MTSPPEASLVEVKLETHSHRLSLQIYRAAVLPVARSTLHVFDVACQIKIRESHNALSSTSI